MTANTALPPLNFLTSEPAFTDYRPAINPAGNIVVFERTVVIGAEPRPTLLYQVTDFANPSATRFLSGVPFPDEQTRPDWCFAEGAPTSSLLVFNGHGYSVWTVGADGANPTLIPETDGFCYPTWSRDGLSLVTESSATSASPKPCNSVFDTGGAIVTGLANIDGADPAGTPLFGGMPTVGPNDLPQIAFAGQPAIAGWAGSKAPKPQYNQSANYIFLNSSADGVYASAPMESGASLTSFDPSHQGRAPAWSPDGKTIAFESNRSGQGYAIYLCDLASGTITQATDPSLNGQHAKFFPCGTKLILCIHHPDGDPKTMGIAWIDVSGLLKP